MILVKCDIEGCGRVGEIGSADAMMYPGATTGLPSGWATLLWTAVAKGEHSDTVKSQMSVMHKMIKAAPEHIRDVLSGFQELPAPNQMVLFRANVCRDCLGRLAVTSSQIVKSMDLLGP